MVSERDFLDWFSWFIFFCKQESIVPSWREQNQSFKHYFSTRLIVARLYMGISKNKVHQSIPRRI